MKYGARNQLICRVTGIRKGDVMSQLKLEIIDGNAMGSVITTESLEELGLAEGDQIKVVVKAINVLPVKE
jgi:molybdate transport system regulatory protein